MAPFATIYSYPNNPRLKRAIVAANVNGLELSFPEFDMAASRDEAFYKKFPLGKVPALETPSGYTLVESGAIAHYVADSGPRSGQLLGTTPESRAKIRQWMDQGDLEFIHPSLPAIQMAIGRREPNEELRKECLEKLERPFKYLETVLQENKWIAGTDDWSMADLTVANFIDSAYMLILGKEWRDKYPRIQEWYERFVAQDGVKGVWGEVKYKD